MKIRKNYLRSQSSSEGVESRGAFRWISSHNGLSA